MKTSVKLLSIALLLAFLAGGLFLIDPARALPAAFSSETAVWQPPEPVPLKSFAPSLREEDEPSPAPLRLYEEALQEQAAPEITLL